MAERLRYTGDLASVDLAIPGAVLRFPRMKWQDPVKLAEEASVDPRHLDIVLAGLGEEWEREGPVKAARTRRQNATASDDPAEPDEEQS